MTGIGAGEAGEARAFPLAGNEALPCASGRCRDGSPCRRLAALAARLALPAKEDITHG